MKISKEHLNKIITEEVQRALSEITDDELERLLAMGREKQSPKEKITQVIGDNPEEATDAMFNILGADGIKDVMIALAHASGDEELLNYTKTMNEQEGVEAKEEIKTISLPKFKISERWGTPGTEDRKTISSFLTKIQGGSLQEKINSLESFVKDCDEACVTAKDVPEILGNLVFLESLCSIIYDFNAKTAGFLWESLLAALIEGEQIEAEGGVKTPIEDLVDAEGNALSLKLLKKGSTYIGGSIGGIKRAFDKFGKVTYIIVTKSGAPEMKMDFYELVLTPENFTRYSRSIKDLKEASGSTTWKIHQKIYEQNKIASLSLGSPDSIKIIASKYADRLGEGVTGIFNSLNNLTNNINLYFVDSPDSKNTGLAAQKNALILKQKVDQEF